MYKAIIVDDEVRICKLVRILGHWDALGVKIIGEYHKVDEAISHILLEKPDIVITDIKMPEKNGFDIIKEVTENNVNPFFIMISGYQEFSYAREAIEHGAIAYLLKPLSEEELNAAITKACNKIEDAKRSGEELKQKEETLV